MFALYQHQPPHCLLVAFQITAKEKADVCAESTALQLLFETKIPVQFHTSPTKGSNQPASMQSPLLTPMSRSGGLLSGRTVRRSGFERSCPENLSLTAVRSKGVEKAESSSSQVEGGHVLLELNVVSPALLCLKAGAREPASLETAVPSPSGCVKTIYNVFGQRAFCCEGQQLVDDILPGLAHTVCFFSQ